jgi:hypothetical protein
MSNCWVVDILGLKRTSAIRVVVKRAVQFNTIIINMILAEVNVIGVYCTATAQNVVIGL